MIEHGRRQAEPHPRRSQSRTTPKRTREGTGRKVGFVLLTLFLVGICTAAGAPAPPARRRRRGERGDGAEDFRRF